MSEKMLVTQALDERDLLVKKIRDKIEKANFADTVKHNEEKVITARVSREEFSKDAESAFQQIQDLISRFQKIDAAIVASNAKTMIKTSLGDYTVAGAISLRSRLRNKGSYNGESDFESALKKKLEHDLEQNVLFANVKNQDLQKAAEGMRLSILGKDAKVKDDKPLEVVDAYISENTTEVVDPLDIRKKVEMLRERRDTLLTELDTQIKVSNATTFIEI
ncbi:MAG: hypothetical protein K6G83_08375 [Lachnospiraceae bacterium]|nr:hypothetical protein [Lachnospiraceae bacterium]